MGKPVPEESGVSSRVYCSYPACVFSSSPPTTSTVTFLVRTLPRGCLPELILSKHRPPQASWNTLPRRQTSITLAANIQQPAAHHSIPFVSNPYHPQDQTAQTRKGNQSTTSQSLEPLTVTPLKKMPRSLLSQTDPTERRTNLKCLLACLVFTTFGLGFMAGWFSYTGKCRYEMRAGGKDLVSGKEGEYMAVEKRAVGGTAVVDVRVELRNK